MSLAKEIRKHRENMGLTQLDLAKKIGVTEKAVSSWEVGRSIPRMGKIQLMAELFDVKPSALLDEAYDQALNDPSTFKYMDNNFMILDSPQLAQLTGDSYTPKKDIAASLTPEEKVVVENYRKLPEEQKKRILLYLMSLISEMYK